MLYSQLGIHESGMSMLFCQYQNGFFWILSEQLNLNTRNPSEKPWKECYHKEILIFLEKKYRQYTVLHDNNELWEKYLKINFLRAELIIIVSSIPMANYKINELQCDK